MFVCISLNISVFEALEIGAHPLPVTDSSIGQRQLIKQGEIELEVTNSRKLSTTIKLIRLYHLLALVYLTCEVIISLWINTELQLIKISSPQESCGNHLSPY